MIIRQSSENLNPTPPPPPYYATDIKAQKFIVYINIVYIVFTKLDFSKIMVFAFISTIFFVNLFFRIKLYMNRRISVA